MAQFAPLGSRCGTSDDTVIGGTDEIIGVVVEAGVDIFAVETVGAVGRTEGNAEVEAEGDAVVLFLARVTGPITCR
jgi:hypothetical protein